MQRLEDLSTSHALLNKPYITRAVTLGTQMKIHVVPEQTILHGSNASFGNSGRPLAYIVQSEGHPKTGSQKTM